MKTPKHLFTAHEIAAAIGRNFNATMEFLKLHDIKPVREIRTGSMTYRQYSKSAMNEAISIADATLKRRKKATPAPAQAPLPFESKDAERIPPFAEAPPYTHPMAGVDIDKAHEPVTATLVVTPEIKTQIERLESINRALVDKANALTIQSARDAEEIARLKAATLPEREVVSASGFNESLALLRSIDDKLGQLLSLWK